jgi:hypothetical protein
MSVTRAWSAVLNAFPTLSCILLKLKHSWNIHQTFILLIYSFKCPLYQCVTSNSHPPFDPRFQSAFQGSRWWSTLGMLTFIEARKLNSLIFHQLAIPKLMSGLGTSVKKWPN